MTRKNYSNKLRDPRWQRKRLEIFERDGWACSWCGNKGEEMQVHHGYYGKDKAGRRRDPWEHPSDTLYSLCDTCHERAETARAAIYLEIGRIHPMHHWDVRRFLQEVQELIESDPQALKESCATSGVTERV